MADGKGAMTGAMSGASTGAAIGGPWGAAIGGVAGGLMGAFGGGESPEEAQRRALKKYLEKIRGLEVGSEQDFVTDYEEIDANQLQYMTPELEAAILAGDTELANIQTDPSLRQAQVDALTKMTRMGEQGLTIEEEAAQNALERDLGTANRGNQEAVLQGMARRGQLGGGAELSARLAGAQNAFENAAKQAEANAVNRNNRQLQATLQAGNMAGNLDAADYGKAKNVADARDAISRFNVGQQSGVQTRNVGNKNTAQLGNNQLKNTAYTSNVDLRNREAADRTAARLKAMEARNNKMRELAGGELKMGDINASENKNDAEGFANLFSSAGKAAEGIWGKK